MIEIFVFGSNLAGRHGKGAALIARHQHGAIYGQGEGLQGRSYAIPTKRAKERGSRLLQPLELYEIKAYVVRFLHFAIEHPRMKFNITPVGCGLAGYKREQVRPFFEPLPANCNFLPEWDAEEEWKEA